MRLNGENLKLEWFNPIKQMRDEEYTFLDHFVRTKTYGNILEIGQGGSTVILLDATADTDRLVYSVDLKFKLKDTMKYLPLDYVERLKFIQEDSQKVNLKEKFGMVLVDGEHTITGVRRDTMNIWMNLDDNGYMLFHDYALQEGVTKFVDDLCNRFNQARFIQQEKNIAVVQKL